MLKFFFNAFRRAKGERVTAEYIIVDETKLIAADKRHFSDTTSELITEVDEEILKDYQEVTRLCKTYIADPVVFELCRKIERRILEILTNRFCDRGRDMWQFEDKPLPLRNEKEDR